MRVGPRERACFVRALTGPDLAAGAEVYVGLDNVVGAPERAPSGDWGHFTRILLRVTGTLATHLDMPTAGMPGGLLANIVQNVRLRAAGKDLIVGSMTGEELNQLSILLFRAQIVPAPGTVADATATGVATGDIWISIPLSDVIRDRFSRESDGSIPVTAFDRHIDGDAGLRFRFAAANTPASGNSSFAGFLNCVLSTIASCDIWVMYRTDKHQNLALPGMRAYNEAQIQFDVEPIGGADGTNTVVAFFDPPDTTSGIRNHAGYSNVSLRAGDDVIYSGRDFDEIADMSNLSDPSLTPAVGRTAPNVLPLFGRRADQSVGECARGSLSVNIGTRTTLTTTRILQHSRQSYDRDAAMRVMKQSGGSEAYAGKKQVATSRAGLAAVLDQKLVRGGK